MIHTPKHSKDITSSTTSLIAHLGNSADKKHQNRKQIIYNFRGIFLESKTVQQS